MTRRPVLALGLILVTVPAAGDLVAGDSKTKMTDWLAEREGKDPKEEADRADRQKAAADRRKAQIEAAIPKAVRAKLDAAKSPDEAVAAFEDSMDGPARAAVSFRLLGLGEGSWNLSSSLEQFVTIALLPRVKAADLAAAAKAAKDPVELAGAGRWLFFEKKWEKLPRDGRDELLKPIAEAALAHPRQLNRRRTMAELKAMGTPAARELLRRAFRSEFTPRPLDKADETEPPGSVEFSPGDGDLDKGSDVAQAARLLAELGDATIKAEVEKRLLMAKGDDRAIYEAARKKLGK